MILVALTTLLFLYQSQALIHEQNFLDETIDLATSFINEKIQNLHYDDILIQDYQLILQMMSSRTYKIFNLTEGRLTGLNSFQRAGPVELLISNGIKILTWLQLDKLEHTFRYVIDSEIQHFPVGESKSQVFSLAELPKPFIIPSSGLLKIVVETPIYVTQIILDDNQEVRMIDEKDPYNLFSSIAYKGYAIEQETLNVYLDDAIDWLNYEIKNRNYDVILLGDQEITLRLIHSLVSYRFYLTQGEVRLDSFTRLGDVELISSENKWLVNYLVLQHLKLSFDYKISGKDALINNFKEKHKPTSILMETNTNMEEPSIKEEINLFPDFDFFQPTEVKLQEKGMLNITITNPAYVAQIKINENINDTSVESNTTLNFLNGIWWKGDYELLLNGLLLEPTYFDTKYLEVYFRTIAQTIVVRTLENIGIEFSDNLNNILTNDAEFQDYINKTSQHESHMDVVNGKEIEEGNISNETFYIE